MTGMRSGTPGQKVKYVHTDAYPGYKQPSEIEPGEIYTIREIGERPHDHKLSGDVTFELEETPGSVYGSKRFEPVPKSSAPGRTIHRGFAL